ncbi:MAG TPA: UvrD-helicase domain-containing protein [Polyangia bacterium]|jgi:DNA helicase-2/ATP-dependent DNA helicase PcrA|nr:UvrD-helicase domain-containing protein [Polyangia bacterium]
MEPDVAHENHAESRREGRPRHEPFSRETLAKELNAAQLEAVVHPAAPLLVVAGAGSGKTRVITYRLARLIATGADPRRILAVTFTNKAAAELRERVRDLLYERMGVGLAGLSVGTFHSICARLLRQYGEAVGLRKDFVIYDTDDQKRLMARVLTDLKVPERMFPVRQVLSAVDRLENQGITASAFQPGDYFDDVVAKAYTLFEERMAAANATDFGGLLLHTLKMCLGDTPVAHMLAERFDHVLVDEFQDTNSVQYKLVRCLSHRTKSITVVGDEDQSIYKWRGADIRNILDFERDHPGAGVVKLERNYRSTGHILRAANAVIEKNTERRPKRLYTEEGEGERIVLFEGETERDEADFVAQRISEGLGEGLSPRDIAVFYRTNAQSRVLEDALRARDIPYVVVGGTRFFDRAEIKDLVCYLRAIANPDDGLALQRIVNVPARGIGQATVDRIGALIYERRISAWDALVLSATDPAAAGSSDNGDLFEQPERTELDEPVLGPGPRKKVAAFVALIEKLRRESAGLSPADLAEKVLEESGYRDALAAEASLEAEGRGENLMEFIAQMREYEREAEEPTLHGFLERIALQSDVDGYDPEKGAVSLMTVHTAKGLEFPTVFITGLEERIFPHARSVDDDSAIEEERRLCYVAVTRARTRLFLSRVRRRRLSGQELPGVPSRFLRELPQDAIDAIVMERPAYYGIETRGRGPWGGSWSKPEPQYEEPTFQVRSSAGYAAPKPPKLAAKPTGEITVDYDHSDSDGPGLQVGAKLRHPSFGVGEIRGWQGSGADLKVTMRFPTVGVKTILARFLTKP